MDDLNSMLSQILNDPQSMQQIQAVASQLGLGGENPGGASAPPPPQPEPGGLDMNALTSLLGGLGAGQSPAPATPPTPAAPSGGGLDMNALSALLGNLANNAPAPTTPTTPAAPAAPAMPIPAASGGGVDLSALSGIVGGLLGNRQSPAQGALGAPSAGGADVSALASLLGGAQPQAPAGGSGLPFDLNTLLKLQKAMSSVSSNKANVDLLLALKPRLKEQRAKKVDDAIKVMQLIQFLPLIKESGLFGSGEGGLSGGLGNVVGGIGDGIGNVLGGLFGGRQR